MVYWFGIPAAILYLWVHPFGPDNLFPFVFDTYSVSDWKRGVHQFGPLNI